MNAQDDEPSDWTPVARLPPRQLLAPLDRQAQERGAGDLARPRCEIQVIARLERHLKALNDKHPDAVLSMLRVHAILNSSIADGAA